MYELFDRQADWLGDLSFWDLKEGVVWSVFKNNVIAY